MMQFCKHFATDIQVDYVDLRQEVHKQNPFSISNTVYMIFQEEHDLEHDSSKRLDLNFFFVRTIKYSSMPWINFLIQRLRVIPSKCMAQEAVSYTHLDVYKRQT